MELSTNRVLLAEDHPVSLFLLKNSLSNWGFDVVTAEDGEAAIRILSEPGAPSLAVIDKIMPKIDGLEICRHVRNQSGFPYTYIILLSGRSQQDEIIEGLLAGADDYVIKPFDPEELRERLRVGQRVVELECKLSNKISELEKALQDVAQLRQLLPICDHCKSIRDDQNYWRQIEEYLHTETGTDFSHGICPTCLPIVMAEWKREAQNGIG